MWYKLDIGFQLGRVFKMSAFDKNIAIPQRRLRAVETSLIAFWCVIFPVFSAIACLHGNQRPVYKSLSFIAYRENHMALVLVYGFMFVAGFIWTMKLCLDQGQYSNNMQYLFLGLSLICALILTIGISVPWIDVEGAERDKFARLQDIHNIVSTIGFVMFFIVELVFFVTTFSRNPKQGLISVGMLAYVLITSIFLLKESNLKNYASTPCHTTSIAQIHVFCSIGFTMTIQYFLMKYIKNVRIEEIKQAR